jgi:hypothetical protein
MGLADSHNALMAKEAAEYYQRRSMREDAPPRRGRGGRRKKVSAADVRAERERRLALKQPASKPKLAKHFGVSESTISRCLKK